MQCALGVLDAAAVRRLRDYAAKHALYIEAIVKLPKDEADVVRFDREMKSAAEVGAGAARTTIIPGRRYEYFDSIEMFNEFDARGRRMLERGALVAETYRVPIAVENHKDHLDDQRVERFEHISSEFVGACVDTGNSFALLEDPIETVTKLAPWAHSVHLKDQALQSYEDGFLLGDIPLGQGGLDLKRMVQILKKTRPGVRFTLELITRDPLKVPCLTDSYWTTFPQRPATELARALRYVRDHSARTLQYISRMSPDEQLAREDANVRQSLDYARDKLGI
jgi:sugar phosphate isomerase/epimerase